MTRSSFMAMRRDELKRRGDAAYLEKRDDVLRQAADVFRRKGFQATTVADIAQQAGMDRATAYLYISSKEEAFEEVVRGAIVENVETAERLELSPAPTLERLDALIRHLIDSYAGHYPYLFLYIQENMNQLDSRSDWGKNMKALSRRFADSVTKIVQQGMDEGAIEVPGNVPAHVVAYGIIGMCNWTHRWYTPSGPTSTTQIGLAYSSIILDGLKRK